MAFLENKKGTTFKYKFDIVVKSHFNHFNLVKACFTSQNTSNILFDLNAQDYFFPTFQ